MLMKLLNLQLSRASYFWSNTICFPQRLWKYCSHTSESYYANLDIIHAPEQNIGFDTAWLLFFPDVSSSGAPPGQLTRYSGTRRLRTPRHREEARDKITYLAWQ